MGVHSLIWLSVLKAYGSFKCVCKIELYVMTTYVTVPGRPRRGHEGLSHCITDYIRFCEDSVVPIKKVRCFPNNKPWINKNIKNLLNRKKRAFMAGDREGVKSVQKELRRELRAAKNRYKERLEGKLEMNSAKEVWDGMKQIT